MTNIKTFRSKDNKAYRFKFRDHSITLKQSQIDAIERRIKELNSDEISEISLHNISFEQSSEIISIIEFILGDKSLEQILDEEIIQDTKHSLDRKGNAGLMIDRDWNQSAVTLEIAECLKKAFAVEQIRVKFDPITRSNEHFRSFGYTVKGLKGDSEGKLVIGIEKDPGDDDSIIILITVLTPGHKKKDSA